MTGEVLQLEPIHSSVLHIAPPQILTRLRLRLLSVQEAESTLDALRGQEGATLEALAKEALDSKLVGKIIRGIVTYRGDERGGRYWIREIHEVPPN